MIAQSRKASNHRARHMARTLDAMADQRLTSAGAAAELIARHGLDPSQARAFTRSGPPDLFDQRPE